MRRARTANPSPAPEPHARDTILVPYMTEHAHPDRFRARSDPGTDVDRSVRDSRNGEHPAVAPEVRAQGRGAGTLSFGYLFPLCLTERAVRRPGGLQVSRETAEVLARLIVSESEKRALWSKSPSVHCRSAGGRGRHSRTTASARPCLRHGVVRRSERDRSRLRSHRLTPVRSGGVLCHDHDVVGEDRAAKRTSWSMAPAGLACQGRLEAWKRRRIL